MTKDGDLRSIFRSRLPAFHWVSVETGLLGRGIPDAEYCSPTGISGWVEFKQAEANAIGLSPEQVGWLVRRRRAGGRAFVAIRRRREKSPRLEPCDELWLYDGAAARDLKDNGLLHEQGLLGHWPGGPLLWNWAQVAHLLVV